MKKHILTCLLVIMITLFTVRCSGSNPESVARAYLNALLANDCNKAGTYVAPDIRTSSTNDYTRFCGTDAYNEIVSMRIDETVIRDWNPLFGSGGKKVTFIGEITISYPHSDSERQYETWSVYLEQLNDGWYVKMGPINA